MTSDINDTSWRPQMNPNFVKSVLKKRQAAKRRLNNRHAIELARSLPPIDTSDFIIFNKVCNRLCKVFKVDFSDVKYVAGELITDRHLTFIRQSIIYWTMRMSPYPVNTISKLMGGCHRTTITYAATSYTEKRSAMHRHIRKIY